MEITLHNISNLSEEDYVDLKQRSVYVHYFPPILFNYPWQSHACKCRDSLLFIATVFQMILPQIFSVPALLLSEDLLNPSTVTQIQNTPDT